MIDRIKKCLDSEIYIYEYAPNEQKMTNVSSILHHNEELLSNVNKDYVDSPIEDACVEDNSGAADILKTLEKKKQLIRDGVLAYEASLSMEGLIEVEPPSKLKRIRVTIVESDLVRFQRYWEKTELEQQILMNELFCVLGRDIINRPYVDDNRILQDSLETIVYRPNHDVTHGVRQTIYSDHIIDIIQKSSDSPFKDVIQKLTVEERACLTIMLFLYRSGRTNEQRSGVDNTYETRSANIFEIVATKLKFNPALVQAMKNSIYFIDFPNPLPYFSSAEEVLEANVPTRLTNLLHEAATGFEGDFETQQTKAYVTSLIAEIGHTMDLVRCSSWRSFFANEKDYLVAKENGLISSRNFKFGGLMPKMKHLLPDEMQVEDVVEYLIHVAKKSCEFTGTPVFYQGFSQTDIVHRYKDKNNIADIASVIQDANFWQSMQGVPEECKGPLLRDIKSYWTIHPGDCVEQLALALPPSYDAKEKSGIEFKCPIGPENKIHSKR
jgi:hypothetical protein